MYFAQKILNCREKYTLGKLVPGNKNLAFKIFRGPQLKIYIMTIEKRRPYQISPPFHSKANTHNEILIVGHTAGMKIKLDIF